MIKKNNGIVCAGNIILDEIMDINRWPGISELSTINNSKFSPGGSAFNVACNLIYFNAPFKIYISGCIGNDKRGEQITKIFKNNKLSIKNIKKLENIQTSYTNVIISPNNKERTFFYYPGTNNKFNLNFIDKELFNNKKIKIFHLGYLCLLKGLEEIDKNKKLKLENLFIKIKKNNIDLSLDTITLESNKHYEKFLHCLKYVDHLIINEKESLLISNLKINNTTNNIKNACKILSSYGIKKNIIVHSKKQIIWFSNNEFIIKKIKYLKKDKIVNSSGSGDAFLAGILWGLNLNYTKIQCIKLAIKFANKNLKDYKSAPLKVF